MTLLKKSRASAIALLYGSGALRYLHWGDGKRLIVFNYHRIRPDGAFSTRFNDELFGPTASVFERQVTWLRNNTQVLSEDDLLYLIRSGKAPPGPSSLITFDDGYRDNYTLGYPVLRHLGIRAIFFVTLDFIDQRRVGWWDLIAYAAKNSPRADLEFEGKKYSRAERERLVHSLLRRIKTEPASRTATLPMELADACGTPLPTRGEQDHELMTWEEIREMHSGGMSIGSHTCSHPVLSRIPAEEQWRELADSKAGLEARIGAPVRSLAYPVGEPADFTEETCRLARKAGYEAAFSFATGTNRWPIRDRFRIARVSAPHQMSQFLAKTRLPAIFAIR
jgi:peptidoglycan/xylan/chitin deacetylase (PgdA/CDA1 family)